MNRENLHSLLYESLLQIRLLARTHGDMSQIHDLADMIHNVPFLLDEKDVGKQEFLFANLVSMVGEYEEKYKSKYGKYSKYIS